MKQEDTKMETSSSGYQVANKLDETAEKRRKNTQDNGEQYLHNDDPNLYYENSSNPHQRHISILRAIGSPYDLRIAGKAFAGVRQHEDKYNDFCLFAFYLPPPPQLSSPFSSLTDNPSHKMPGSSRMPVSLRNSFTVKKGSSSGSQLLALNIDLTLYGLFLRAPGVRSQVQKQVSEAITKLQGKLVPTGPGVVRYLTLPKEGWSEETVMKELETLANMDHTRWEDGFVSGAVYHGGDSLMKLQTEAFGKFTVANPIHPDVFPGVRKMEAEIVAMILSIFNAPPGAAGVTTSGGTESILMACLSARQKAYAERGVKEPEMILPETAHTAFRKAGQYFGIKIHLVACPAPSYQVHLPSVSRLINSNTVLLVGSAPNFPHGLIDDITGLSKLAVKRKIPLHVDCCLGSFLVPFLEKAGFETELFDFRLKGVTSISCDTHKYGFAPKGNSTVLYRTAALRTYQYFISPDWSGGVYASPSIAGSRPGALIAGCWASLMSVGETGYINACNEIVGATKKIIEAINENPSLNADLHVLGKPLVSVVAFTSKTLDIYDIADAMSAKGWHLNSLQSPPAIHVAVTLPIVKVWEKLVEDLIAVVEAEKEKERVRIVEGKGAKGKSLGDSAALYGVAGSLPNKSVVVELASGFLDTLYKA
ncbi:Dihydrosphingosine phosphate lyase [Ciborinia camelliae]|nr:Dihydrosphingosine phosphate lyase [Ciborinia camelliae]